MLRVIFGPDTFTVRERLREVLAACSDGGQGGEGVQWLDGKSIEVRDIIEACGQGSMFASTKVVVVEGLLSRFSRGDSRGKAPRGKKRRAAVDVLGTWQGFGGRVKALPESSMLVLIDAELKEPNPLLDELALQAEEVVRCPALAGSDLVHWIQERAVSGGSRLEGAVASRLAAIVGPDLWLMHSELEKLIVYADGRPITIRMVDDMAASAPAPTIFMLVDAIVERNMRLAHTRLDDLYMKGLPAGYVFTMVARQLRLIAQVHEGRGWSGTPPSGELAGLAPFALQRVSRQAQRLPEAATRRALEHVRDADRAIKTGQMSDRVALDMLISDIVGASGA